MGLRHDAGKILDDFGNVRVFAKMKNLKAVTYRGKETERFPWVITGTPDYIKHSIKRNQEKEKEI